MARTIKVKTDDLYDSYENLSEKEVEFIKLVTNPENILKGITEQEIADTLGVSLKTPHNWRQKPAIREAIYRETMLKAANDLPSMLTELRKICDQDKDYKAKVTALTVWFKINGIISDAKDMNVDKNSKLRDSVEKRLIEIGEQSRHSLIQPPK